MPPLVEMSCIPNPTTLGRFVAATFLRPKHILSASPLVQGGLSFRQTATPFQATGPKYGAQVARGSGFELDRLIPVPGDLVWCWVARVETDCWKSDLSLGAEVAPPSGASQATAPLWTLSTLLEV
jgi:hypothetical protein